MKSKGSSAHTVTRSEYYAGRRVVDPERPASAGHEDRLARVRLEDQPYPRVDLEVAVDAMLARLDSPP